MQFLYATFMSLLLLLLLPLPTLSLARSPPLSLYIYHNFNHNYWMLSYTLKSSNFPMRVFYPAFKGIMWVAYDFPITNYVSWLKHINTLRVSSKYLNNYTFVLFVGVLKYSRTTDDVQIRCKVRTLDFFL